MNFLLRKSHVRVFFSVALALGIASCSDDEPTKDEVAPEVTVTSIANNAVLFNTINVAIDATDNAGLEKVEIFVDGVLVTTITEAPFEFSWDSNTVADGTHTVTVVATDKTGNQTAQDIPVTVKNVLASISIKADQLYSSANYTERGFVFLSDETGKLIASVEYHNGQKIELKAPSFTGETFYLTEAILEADLDDDEEYIRLFTYPQVERGKWTILDDENDEDPTFVGEADLTFTNAATDYYYQITTREDGNSVDEFFLNITLQLTRTPANLIIIRGNYVTPETPKTYKFYTGITTGTNAAINLAQVTTPMSFSNATIPAGALSAEVELYGLEQAGNFETSYFLGYSSDYTDPTTLKVEYPGATFPAYYSESYYETETGYFGASTAGQLFDFTPLQYNYNANVTATGMTYSASGNYDVIIPFFGDGDYQDWLFILPTGSNQSIVFPEIPAALVGKTPDLTQGPLLYTIYDFAGMSNYAGVKDFLRASENGIADLDAKGRSMKSMDFYTNSGSGKKKQLGATPLSARERFEKKKGQ